MRTVRSLVRCLVGTSVLAIATAALADGSGDGLAAPGSGLNWERWQGRVNVSNDSSALRTTSTGQSVSGLSVMSDYYFAPMPLGAKGAGGFRATSGVLFGSGGSTWGLARHNELATPYENANDLTSTTPYLGIGYSGLTGDSGWGFAADLGVLGRPSNSGLRVGRNSGNGLGLDDPLHELRFAPVVQLGVSYKF